MKRLPLNRWIFRMSRSRTRIKCGWQEGVFLRGDPPKVWSNSAPKAKAHDKFAILAESIEPGGWRATMGQKRGQFA